MQAFFPSSLYDFVARAVFTLDKTLDRVFEQELMTFLKNADIAIQQE